MAQLSTSAASLEVAQPSVRIRSDHNGGHQHSHHKGCACLDPEHAALGFAALGSPARLQVLGVLVKAGPPGLSVGQIEQRSGIKGSTLAHHLRALVGAGLAEQVKQGRAVVTRAAYHPLEALADYILQECCADLRSIELAANPTKEADV